MDEKKRARLEAAIPPQGSGTYPPSEEVTRKAARIADWAYWPAGRVVEIWQAVALSLGIDPDSLEFSPFGHIRDLFNPEVRADFAKRLKMIAALTEYSARLPLSEYVENMGALSMPPELAALAAPVASVNSPSSAELTEIPAISGALENAAPTASSEQIDDDESMRRTRLYEEIEMIKGFELMTEAKICACLGDVARGTQSCVTEITVDSIKWKDRNGGNQKTSRQALGKWLQRNQKRKLKRS